MNPLDARVWGVWDRLSTAQKRRLLAVLKRLVEAQDRAAGGAA